MRIEKTLSFSRELCTKVLALGNQAGVVRKGVNAIGAKIKESVVSNLALNELGFWKTLPADTALFRLEFIAGWWSTHDNAEAIEDCCEKKENEAD